MPEHHDHERLTQPENTSVVAHPAGRHRADEARHLRLRRSLAGRRRYLGVALAALTACGLVGATSIVQDAQERRNTAGTDLLDASRQDRAEAAERPDRALRTTPSVPATPTAAATPSGAPETGNASPAATAPATTAPASASAKPKSSPSATAQAAAARSTAAWVHPLPGAAVTSCYGPRWGVLHAGIDLAMPAGTPVRAAGAGTVTEAGWVYSGYGISVVVDHGNGYLTHYAHLNSTSVTVGQQVSAGQTVGKEGSTGDSTGPHLHFEVHNGLWNQIDPAPWMRARGVNLGC